MPVSFDDFEDDEHVMKPRRAYTDIVRQDSSVELRARFRSMWGTGEQLWDVDYNNNLSMLSWWAAIDVWRYSSPSHPWIASVGNFYIARSGAYKDLVVHSSPGGVTYYVPPVGAKVYAKAERLCLVYTNSGWKPAFYAKRHPKEIEISLFAHRPTAGQVCASYVAAQPFELRKVPGEAFDRWSRFRTNRNESWGYLLKNGVEIGNAFFHRNGGYPSGRVSLLSDVTTFDVGDVLQMRAPSPLMGITWMNFTLLGNLLV